MIHIYTRLSDFFDILAHLTRFYQPISNFFFNLSCKFISLATENCLTSEQIEAISGNRILLREDLKHHVARCASCRAEMEEFQQEHLRVIAGKRMPHDKSYCSCEQTLKAWFVFCPNCGEENHDCCFEFWAAKLGLKEITIEKIINHCDTSTHHVANILKGRKKYCTTCGTKFDVG